MSSTVGENDSIGSRASSTAPESPPPAPRPSRQATSRTEPPNASRHGRAARRPRAIPVTVLVVGLLLTLGLSLGTAISINDSDNRQLSSQLQEVSLALQGASTSISQLLTFAAQEAEAGTSAFKEYASSQVGVGPSAPFLSMSMWSQEPRSPRLLAVEGHQPLELLNTPILATRFLRGVRPSPELSVFGLVDRPVRALGLALMLPDSTSRLFVYAESPFPTTPGSQFAGLPYALYLGTRPSPATLMVSSIHLPPRGRTATEVVPFGDMKITIVTTLAAGGSGLPSQLPWTIAIAGVGLTLLATFTVSRLQRRREAAESVATERTAQYDTQRGIAETLQHALLPAQNPTFPGLEIATRYVAGVEHLDVGGDWYDVIALDADRLFITIGDVSGRGLVAATMMGTIRHSIRAYAVQGDPPEVVLRKLDDLVDVQRDDCFATVCCAVLDVPGHLVTVASAGHPPPLVLDGAGARFLVPPLKPPVGVPSAAVPSASTSVVGPGAILVLYTDGLVERRGESLDVGLEHIRLAVGDDGGADRPMRALVDSLAPDGLDDDVAILGLRWLQ